MAVSPFPAGGVEPPPRKHYTTIRRASSRSGEQKASVGQSGARRRTGQSPVASRMVAGEGVQRRRLTRASTVWTRVTKSSGLAR